MKRNGTTGRGMERGFDGTTDLYLRDIRKYVPLSRAEEARLLAGARKGNRKALNQLITANLRFVVRVAGEYNGRGLPLSDLIAEGNVGLIRATRTFDSSRGNKFITYAVWWIRQAILSALNRQPHLVSVPANQIDDLDAVNRAASALSQELGRSADLTEVAETTEMSMKRVRRAVRANQMPLSMDRAVYEDGNVRFGDTLADAEPGPDDLVDEGQTHDLLWESLEELPEREAKILSLYFGLETDEPESLERVGRRLHISRERVRQIKDRAINRLREQMVGEEMLS